MSKIKNITKKTLLELSRIILGVTFIFSGFVKSVDPIGTVYKIQDYLISFGLSNFESLAYPVSIILCAGELCLGLFMLFGLYRKWTSRLMFLVMLFMTPLTLYLAIANPVKDCGCFGDALIISNWQTFYKNILLMLCSVATLLWYEKISNIFTGKFYWLVAIYITFCSIAFCLYNIYNEPIIDFRPYKAGANIPQLMTVEEGKAPLFENTFIYEKDGIKKEFTEDNYPWQDSTWIFVDRYSKLIKEGEEPKIKDFSINKLYLNKEGTEFEAEENITQEVLSDSSYTFLMTAYSLPEMNSNNLGDFIDVSNYAKDFGYKFYCLTSTSRDQIIEYEKQNITNFEFCLSDERTLKTITRSNPGLLLIKNGTIIKKWGNKDIPDERSLDKPIENLSIGIMDTDIESDNNRELIKILLIFIIPLLVVKILDAGFYQIRKEKKEKLKDSTETKE